MLDFKIEVGESVEINGVKIERVNRMYYYVNEEEVKVKKSAVLTVINNKEVWLNGNVDWKEVDRLLRQAGSEGIEFLSEDVVLFQRQLFVDGEGICDTYEVNENGDSEWEPDEEKVYKYVKLLEEYELKTLHLNWDGSPTVYHYSLMFYDNKTKTNKMFQYLMDDFNNDINYNYYWNPNSIGSIIAKKLDVVRSWFKHEGIFESDSVRIYWEGQKDKIYNSIFETIKGSETKQELIDRLDKWINTNKFEYVHEVYRIRKEEIDYAYRRSQEEKRQRKAYEERARLEAEKGNELVERAYQLVKGLTYREACKLLHPDISKVDNAKELFQIVQEYKEMWF